MAAPSAPTPALPGAGVPPTVAPVHDQVVQVVAPLRAGPDGAYSLTLRLEPQGLGQVVAHVEVAGGQVSVHLTAETAEGHSALSAGMDQLAQSLSRPGSPASVHLRSWAGGGGAPGQGGGGPAPDHQARRSFVAPGSGIDGSPDPDPTPLRPLDPDRLVDVQL
ncbi:MAG TPA: flagellar hook-length control protein FliK [Acidimicrobiales bacterium]|nr:flagellar hook-length control protein FliK [Acidimicrobiales bacterium]